MFVAVVFCVTLLMVSVDADECPPGYVIHQKSCYDLVRVKANWADANVYCAAVGAHLATVRTHPKYNFLNTYLREMNSTIDTDGGSRCLDYEKEGVWEWGYNGGIISNTWWGPGAPDNVKRDDNTQNCLMMSKIRHFTWDDQYCSKEEYFLCEVDSLQESLDKEQKAVMCSFMPKYGVVFLNAYYKNFNFLYRFFYIFGHYHYNGNNSRSCTF